MRTTIAALTLLFLACGRSASPLPVEPAQTTEALEGCGLDGAPRPLLAGWTEDEVFVVRSDGTRQVLLRRAWEVGGWLSMPVVRGNFLAVRQTGSAERGYVTDTLLFDSEGRYLASLEGASADVISSDGIVAAHHLEGLALLRPDGRTTVKPGLYPMGQFGPGGLLPVQRSDADDSRLALYDPAADSVRELPVPAMRWAGPLWSGETLVYLGELGGNQVLVRHAGAQTQTTLVSSENTIGPSTIESISETEAVLQVGTWAARRFRLDLVTGVLTPIDLKPPAGHVLAGFGQAQLWGTNLVAVLSNGEGVGLFQSSDGTRWSALGPMVEEAQWGQFVGKGGSFVLTATGDSMLTGAATVLAMVSEQERSVRLPALSLGTELGEESISSDGRCVALWTPTETGDALAVVDLVAGTQRRLLNLTRSEGRAPGPLHWLGGQ